ncbi:nucleotide sugar dehydrogenase [Lentzea jiangxiensis]|uniref:UDP-N-acetyl-D-glucosamine dehydrogenase n=1 Tax=Lentzea jiangxiensis TaxID=641025 RepID=A0A1H0WGV5_9PSEU|nr:nucleotide sugar dehydrogenase [Lentzea jiangxiensis]SDP89725.1 UDP-N-acetyl-D-glucosamine dehydrogenase [Lentzea jiangxiensis]
MDTVVIGLGFTGLPVAVAAATADLHVLGVDASASRIHDIATGAPGCGLTTVDETALAGALRSGRLSLKHNEIVAADNYVLCVPTPPDRHGGLDTTMLVNAADRVGAVLPKGALVIIQSTCEPGTVDQLLSARLATASGLRPGTDFHLAHSPVRTDPGSTASAPRVVAGLTSACADRATELLRRLSAEVVTVSTLRAAELTKVFENTFRLVNISLANELHALCRAQGVDVHEVMDAAGSKPFGFLPHRPSPGAGGDCIPVSAGFFAANARRYGLHSPVVDAAITVNNSMPAHTLHRVRVKLAELGLPMRHVHVLGVTYKPGVANVRQSPALRMINELSREAVVTYHDPLVPELLLDNGTRLTSQPVDTAADVVLVMAGRTSAPHRTSAPVIDCTAGDAVPAA